MKEQVDNLREIFKTISFNELWKAWFLRVT